MREKFNEIMKKHGFYTEDPEDIIYTVQDMLELVLKETKEKEPYAINSIADLEIAVRQVGDLLMEI